MNPVAPKPNARRSRRQDGMALVLVLLVIAVLALLGIAGTRSAQTELQMGQKELVGRQALGAAEAGINHAYSLIKANLANRLTYAGGSTTDSFDSRDAAYNAATAGSAGSVRANGNVSLSGGSTLVHGDATAGGTVSASGGSSVTGTTANGAATMSFDPVSACGPPWSNSTGISWVGTNGSYNSSTGVLTVSNSSTTATLAGGTYCFSAITLSGGGIMSVASAVSM